MFTHLPEAILGTQPSTPQTESISATILLIIVILLVATAILLVRKVYLHFRYPPGKGIILKIEYDGPKCLRRKALIKHVMENHSIEHYLYAREIGHGVNISNDMYTGEIEYYPTGYKNNVEDHEESIY